jgi:transposase-like protein
MNKPRKHYSPQQKVAIIKKHLLEKVPVSDLCDKYDLQPNVFYRWQKQFFENGALTFQRQTGAKPNGLEKKVEALQQKLTQKNEVLSELMEEHIALKKSLGEI